MREKGGVRNDKKLVLTVIISSMILEARTSAHSPWIDTKFPGNEIFDNFKPSSKTSLTMKYLWARRGEITSRNDLLYLINYERRTKDLLPYKCLNFTFKEVKDHFAQMNYYLYCIHSLGFLLLDEKKETGEKIEYPNVTISTDHPDYAFMQYMFNTGIVTEPTTIIPVLSLQERILLEALLTNKGAFVDYDCLNDLICSLYNDYGKMYDAIGDEQLRQTVSVVNDVIGTYNNGIGREAQATYRIHNGKERNSAYMLIKQ